MYQTYLDKVVTWATSERFKDDVAAARKEFAAQTGGEVFEDDRSVESRLAAFVDWYVFDRVLRPPASASARPPAEPAASDRVLRPPASASAPPPAEPAASDRVLRPPASASARPPAEPAASDRMLRPPASASARPPAEPAASDRLLRPPASASASPPAEPAASAPALDGLTPAAAYLIERAQTIHPSELAIYRAFTETVRGLFELKRPPKHDRLRARELCADKDYEVFERRTLAGLAKGDVFEARLIPFEGELYFSSSFCYHPRAAKKAIVAEVKRRRKAGTLDRGAFLDALLSMELKFERYRNVAVEAIYSFKP